MSLRILVADDHILVRDAIAAFLQADDFADVTTVSSLPEALDTVREVGEFDLVLLDYSMPGMDGLDGLAKMRKANKEKPVAILSGTAPREVAEAALKAGAQGFVPKTLAAKSLVVAAQFMAAGEIYAPFGFMQQNEDDGTGPMTKRELEVLRGICQGKSNKEIARDTDLQEVTIKLHVKTLCRKLGARNRTQAAMIARDRYLV